MKKANADIAITRDQCDHDICVRIWRISPTLSKMNLDRRHRWHNDAHWDSVACILNTSILSLGASPNVLSLGYLYGRYYNCLRRRWCLMPIVRSVISGLLGMSVKCTWCRFSQQKYCSVCHIISHLFPS